jgi:thioredoxin-like negative regulator of GroEL
MRFWQRTKVAWVLATTCILVAVAGISAYSFWMKACGFKLAQQAAGVGNWSTVRRHLSEYLDLYPSDQEARLLMAEAIVKRDIGDPRKSAEQAIVHLQKIHGKSLRAATARLQEARLSFLILQQPARAERLLHESLTVAPDSFDANYLLWKLLDLTGRHIISAEYFWKVYELTPQSERGERLREWYLAEFYPETANESFLTAFGATAVGKIPASVNLLVKFRESEPQAGCVHAALAKYYLENGKPGSAMDLLKESPDLSQSMQDPFFVAILFETLIELGEFEKARKCFQQYPEPHTGYLFWRTEGIFRQHVVNDAAAAVSSYEQCLTTWPAKFDWNVMVRLSDCLRKAGRRDDAENLKSRVTRLTTEELTIEKTSQLRDGLRKLNDSEIVSEVRDLYRTLGLEAESNAWEEYRRDLSRHSQSPGHDTIEKKKFLR